MASVTGGLARPPRFVLDRLLPDAGEGPGEETVRTGFYDIEIHARTPAGERWCCHVSAQGDPGYGATSVIFVRAHCAWRSTATDSQSAPAF